MDNTFYHKGCGGSMSIDILKNFSWKTPSISLTTDGIKIGVTEFRGTNSRKSGISFCCSKCEEEILLSKSMKEIELECTICQKKDSVDKFGTCRQLQCVCEDCQNVLTGKKEPTNARQKDFIQYLFLGTQKDIVFIPVADILEKSVLF